MYLGSVLFTRLPQVAALFRQGVVGYRVVAAIADRTDLVTDAEALAAIDAALAGLAAGWGPLSRYRLEQVIDVVIDRHDPGALRRTRSGARSRGVQIGGACHAICVSPGWSIIGSPFGRTGGVFCDQDHRVGCFGEVGCASAGGGVFG
jgi:hypothetical protein